MAITFISPKATSNAIRAQQQAWQKAPWYNPTRRSRARPW